MTDSSPEGPGGQLPIKKQGKEAGVLPNQADNLLNTLPGKEAGVLPNQANDPPDKIPKVIEAKPTYKVVVDPIVVDPNSAAIEDARLRRGEPPIIKKGLKNRTSGPGPKF